MDIQDESAGQSSSNATETENNKTEDTVAFVIAAIIGLVVVGFFTYLVYKMILDRREKAEKAKNEENISKITGRPKKTVTFKDEVESENALKSEFAESENVLKNEFAESDDSDGDEDSGIKIDIEDEDDDDLKFQIDEDDLKIEVDVHSRDEVIVNLTTS